MSPHVLIAAGTMLLGLGGTIVVFAIVLILGGLEVAG